MNMTCGNRTIKYIMFVFNFLFVITGIIIIAVGATVKANYIPYDTLLDNTYFSLPNMLIATGSFIFIISFLGCYGAMKENWVLLMLFSVLLTIIFIFELSVGIAGYVLRDKTSSYLQNELFNSMPHYRNVSSVSTMWDLIQEEFQCCGVRNYSDWQTIFETEYLPVSCCPPTTGVVGVFYCNAHSSPSSFKALDGNDTVLSTTELPTEPSEVTTDPATTVKETDATTDATTVEPFSTTLYPPSSSSPYQIGCQSAFGSFVKEHAVKIGAVGISLAVIQLAGIILSFHLARQVKNGYYST